MTQTRNRKKRASHQHRLQKNRDRLYRRYDQWLRRQAQSRRDKAAAI